MKVRIDKAALMVPLYRAQGAADERSNQSNANVTACVHIEAEEDRLVLSATDYEVTVNAEVSAEVIEAGSALVSAKGLFQVVRALADGAVVTLTSDENHRMRIEAGRAYFHLNGLPPYEFPPQNLDSAAGRMLLTDKVHVEAMLRHTLFSVSTDDRRPAISGILLEVEPESDGQVRLRMVSTDGLRLSKVERTILAPDFEGGKLSCIVHRRGAAELQRLIEGSDPALRIEFVGRNLVFSSDRTRLQVRQVEANFPDYTRVVPDHGDHVVTVPREALATAIRRVALLGVKGRDDHIQPLKLEIEPGRIQLEMNFPSYGDAHEELEFDSWQGAAMKFLFNPKHLLDVCNVIGGENITLELRDQLSPCLVHSDEEPGSQFVIMPMRL